MKRDELPDSEDYHIPRLFPTISLYNPSHYFGSISENYQKNVDNYINFNCQLFSKKNSCPENDEYLSSKKFKNLMMLKYIKTLSDPGECVGVLAGQSIGEPSTQMTLNTFHFAGRGEMNVTLGIPRLREILMIGSENIKTPTMSIPILPTKLDDFKHKIKKVFTNVPLKNLIDSVDIIQKIDSDPKSKQSKVYQFFKVTMHLSDENLYKEKYNIAPKDIIEFIEKRFIRVLLSKCLFKLRNFTIELSVSDDIEVKDNKSNDEDSGEENISKTIVIESSENEESEESEYDKDLKENDHDTLSENEEEKQPKTPVSSDIEILEKDITDLSNVTQSIIINEKDKIIEKSDVFISKPEKIKRLLSLYSQLDDYDYDEVTYKSCEMTFKFVSPNQRIIVQPIIKSIIDQLMVYSIDNIQRLFISSKDNNHLIQTEGINILEMWKYGDILDLSKLWTNNIHEMVNRYGIEVGRIVLIKEIKNVFGAYGITIDQRHLTLVGDFMTYWGRYSTFNRMGISNCCSPLQKMSFEASMSFLKQAASFGHRDSVKSPSSRLVIGQPVENGTNFFHVLTQLSEQLH